MKFGKSERTKSNFVSSIACYNEDSLLLFGRRQDNNKYTLPGGRLEPQESPTTGALRELFEETGLTPKDGLEFIGSSFVKGPDVYVYAFKCTVDGTPNSDNDPDEEMEEFQWVDPNNIPDEILDNLHSKKNVTLIKLGLQEGELDKSENNSFWLSCDLRIPTKNNPKRLIWDEAYLSKTEEIFVKNNETAVECYIDISKVEGYNLATNKNRLNLYKRMLKSGEELPPVVIRYDGDGLSLVDGNHRQEACLQSGVRYTKALVLIDSLNKSENLEKASILAPLMASGLLLGGPMNHDPKPTVHSIAQGMGIKTWTPEGLDKELYPIAHLESSWGKNMTHAPHSKGDYHTAYGAVGLKPVSAHEAYKKSAKLQREYPGLNDPADFLKIFKTDPVFYNKTASTLYHNLKVRHKTPERTAFAWRHGTGAAKLANNDMISKDPYVSKYASMLKGK